MPVTIVMKIIGAMTIFINLIKMSPSGFNDVANSGATTPSTAPARTHVNTCTVRFLYQRVGDVVFMRIVGSDEDLGIIQVNDVIQ